MSEIPTQRAVAIVDDGAVERNCARLARELDDGVRLCAVVKADGYGHGAIACARAALAGGASWLAVAAAAEAAELRAELSGVPILTMGALTGAELDTALRAESDVAAWRPEFPELIAKRGAELGVRPRVHVKYDSGMGRLGERDADAVLSLVDRIAADDRLELGFELLRAAATAFRGARRPGSR
jgi:alanine racemase